MEAFLIHSDANILSDFIRSGIACKIKIHYENK